MNHPRNWPKADAEKTNYEHNDDPIWDFPSTVIKWSAETTDKAAITVELSTDDTSDWNVNKEALEEFVFGQSF